MSGYCSQSDLYAFGLKRGALRNPGRQAARVSGDTDAITLEIHGFELNDPVRLRAEAGGLLPQPLVAGVTYYAIPIDESSFQIAAVASGSAIDFETDGSRVAVIAPLNIEACIEYGARLIDDMLPAHAVPLTEPFPPIITMTNAELAAGKAVALSGGAGVSLSTTIDAAAARLARWAKEAVPLRGAGVANQKPTSTAISAPPCDTDGWRKFGGT